MARIVHLFLVFILLVLLINMGELIYTFVVFSQLALFFFFCCQSILHFKAFANLYFVTNLYYSYCSMFPKKKLLFNVYEYPFYFMRFCNLQRQHWRLDLIKMFVQSKAEHGMALVGALQIVSSHVFIVSTQKLEDVGGSFIGNASVFSNVEYKPLGLLAKMCHVNLILFFLL